MPLRVKSVTHHEAVKAAALELSFDDAKVRDLFCKREALVKEYGAALAKTICCRLAILSSAPSLAEVPVVRPVGLTPFGDRGQFAVAVGPTCQLVLQPLSVETVAMNHPSRISKLMIVGLVQRPSGRALRT